MFIRSKLHQKQALKFDYSFFCIFFKYITSREAKQFYSTSFDFFVKFVCKANYISKINKLKLLDETMKYINKGNILYKDNLHFV